MGRITAGATHEMKNVLAIIRESAGLMQDLLTLTQDDSFPHREKFLRVLSNINGQVNRGVDLASALNSFAHSPDQPVATVDMNQLLDQLLLLCQRFATSKKIVLRKAAHQKPLPLSCDPIKTQMTIFAGIDLILNSAEAGSVVTVKPLEGDAGSVAIEFACEATTKSDKRPFDRLADSPLWHAVHASAETLGARIASGSSPVWFTITFPGVPIAA
jgi:nitrogen fixation/metabolism regulation signal transduction histidine kinase